MPTSAMCMSAMQRSMTGTGHGEPAMMPVRSDDRSYDPKSRSPCIAMNIVGTPYRPVQRSSCTARRVAAGSNAGAGTTMQAPCEVQPRLPITMPKQW